MSSAKYKIGDIVWFDPSTDNIRTIRSKSEPVKIMVLAIAQNKDNEDKWSYAVDVSDIDGYDGFEKITDNKISLWGRSQTETITYSDDIGGKIVRWLEAKEIIDLAERSNAAPVVEDKGGLKYI
jgi:hypothetical protein